MESISNRIKVGKIVSAVGIKGEVKVYPYTDYIERFEELDSVYADDDPLKIEKIRYQKNMVIIKFLNIDDRNAAESLRNKFLTIDKKDLRQLDEDEYYIFDLIGLNAVNQTDEYIGKVSDVIQNTAQDLYEITTPDDKKYLVPAVKAFITDIDIEHGIIRINPIEGLFDEPEEV